MNATALAGRGALVFVPAARSGATPAASHDSPDAATDPGRWSCSLVSCGFMHSFDAEVLGVVARATAVVADRFGVAP